MPLRLPQMQPAASNAIGCLKDTMAIKNDSQLANKAAEAALV